MVDEDDPSVTYGTTSRYKGSLLAFSKSGAFFAKVVVFIVQKFSKNRSFFRFERKWVNFCLICTRRAIKAVFFGFIFGGVLYLQIRKNVLEWFCNCKQNQSSERRKNGKEKNVRNKYN